VHCGFTEKTIDDFSYMFYRDCITELALKLNYDAVVNILGNSFAGESSNIVNESNPMLLDPDNIPKTNKKLTMNDLRSVGLV
jgi:hypothetical protein